MSAAAEGKGWSLSSKNFVMGCCQRQGCAWVFAWVGRRSMCGVLWMLGPMLLCPLKLQGSKLPMPGGVACMCMRMCMCMCMHPL